MDYSELLSVGQVALVEAAKLWPGQLDFAPFATTRIVNRMRDAIRDSSRIKRNTADNQPLNDEAAEPDEESVYYVRDWIDRLPPGEQLAIRLAYGIGTKKRTNDQIAARMRMSKAKAAALIQSGLLRLRYMATVELTNGP